MRLTQSAESSVQARKPFLRPERQQPQQAHCETLGLPEKNWETAGVDLAILLWKDADICIIKEKSSSMMAKIAENVNMYEKTKLKRCTTTY